jgi:uncharacterized protein YndB with AHSA1/START domain
MANPGMFQHEIVVRATGMQVLFAFLDPEAIKSWWGARNVVIEPRPGGLLVIEWEPGRFGEDNLLGPLGGVFAGIVDRSQAGHFVHFGSLYWLSPKGDALGPTRLEVTVRSRNDPREAPTLLQVVGSGYHTGRVWDRWFEVSQRAWEHTIVNVQAWCETQAPEQPEQRVLGLGDSYLAEAVNRRRRIS